MSLFIRRWLITRAMFRNVKVIENALRQRQKMFIEDVRRSVNVGSLYGKWPGSETINHVYHKSLQINTSTWHDTYFWCHFKRAAVYVTLRAFKKDVRFGS